MRKLRHEVTRKLILESSGMANQIPSRMQSATRNIAAAHMMPWFAFTMPLAMWSKRT